MAKKAMTIEQRLRECLGGGLGNQAADLIDSLRAELAAIQQCRIAVGEDLLRRAAEIMQGKIDLLNEEAAAKDQRIARMEAALNKIAQWNDGEEVTGMFDEPYSAHQAREALKGCGDAR